MIRTVSTDDTVGISFHRDPYKRAGQGKIKKGISNNNIFQIPAARLNGIGIGHGCSDLRAEAFGSKKLVYIFYINAQSEGEK